MNQLARPSQRPCATPAVWKSRKSKAGRSIGLAGLAIAVVCATGCGASDSNPGTGGTGGSGAVAGNAGSGGASGSGTNQLVVFVTSTTQDANFGGVEGADALCASQAADAGLQGTFRAWLSPIASPVVDRWPQRDADYVLVDGTLVANDFADLVDGSIAAPINLDATGAMRFGDVWTGTLTTGAAYEGNDCEGFTNAASGIALCGNSQSTNGRWTENVTPACRTPLRLYCFQQ